MPSDEDSSRQDGSWTSMCGLSGAAVSAWSALAVMQAISALLIGAKRRRTADGERWTANTAAKRNASVARSAIGALLGRRQGAFSLARIERGDYLHASFYAVPCVPTV